MSSHALTAVSDLVLLKDRSMRSQLSAANALSTDLSDDDAIVAVLKARHSNGQIYTHLGAGAIVMVNPVVNTLADMDQQEQEQEEAAVSRQYADWASNNEAQEALPAHVYDIANSAFYHMCRDQQDQSILLLGETGSGKSEARKIIVRQLCALSKSANKKSKVISGVTKSETILEAFGNATTIDNPNSSRFGRYVEYQFDDAGKLIGSKLLDYLLEKSRVVSIPDSELNFHIFYQLLAGATHEERSYLRLADVSHFKYLARSSGTAKHAGGYTSVGAAAAAAKFDTLREHLKSVGIGKRQQTGLFQTLAAILHLGNITFYDDINKPPGEACEVRNHDVLALTATLLGVLPVNLEYALTYKTKLIRKEICTVYLTAADAEIQRDSLATALYSLIFSWLVEHLNHRLDAADDAASSTFIGILDMAGFQDYKHNAFEQLLYNHSNERLQQFAMHRFFSERREEYAEEGVPVVSRSGGVPDNKASVELLRGEGGRDGDSWSSTLLGLVNAESRVPDLKRPDERLVDLLNEKLANHPAYVCSNSSSTNFASIKRKGAAAVKELKFGVRHYAGLVSYDAHGFVEKNTEALSLDFISLFLGSGAADMPPTENMFIRTLFSGNSSSTAVDASSRLLGGVKISKQPLRHPSMKRPKPKKTGDAASVELSSIEALEGALNEVFDALADTVPWFVFCVKPNEDLSDSQFDARTVKGQLVHLGIPQAIIDRSISDYTASYLFDDFKTRFRVIIEPMQPLETQRSSKVMCREFASAAGWTDKDLYVGRTRVFVAEKSWRALENELRTIELALKEERRAKRRSEKAVSQMVSDMGGDSEAFFANSSVAEDDLESHYGTEFQYNAVGGEAESQRGDVEKGKFEDSKKGYKEASADPSSTLITRGRPKKPRSSKQRRRWLCLTWGLTWWIPSFCLSICGKMKRPDVRMAWREKLALCIIILFMCLFLLFFIIVFGQLLCPTQQVYSSFELAGYTDFSNPLVSAYGRVFKINNIVQNHIGATAASGYGVKDYEWKDYLGQDVSKYFYKTPLFTTYCPGLEPPQAGWDNLVGSRPSINESLYPYHHAIVPGTNTQRLYLEYMNQFAIARLAWPMSYISSTASPTKKLIVIYDNVYDVTAYASVNNNFLGLNVQNLFNNYFGQDATKQWKDIAAGEGLAVAQNKLFCMNNLFYIGTIDNRSSFRCQFSNYILLASSIVLVLVIGVKFLAALQFGSKREPEDHDKFVICQVPCYTEGQESLAKTLESLATLRYDDKRKLIFIVADGMIIGSGNDRPTPRIVLDILGVDPSLDPEPLRFESLGEGDKQLNFGKVYSGLYEVSGRNVPFIVVVKVGKPTERNRPGNRGKRDSQMILMRFLNRVHFNGDMNPMELELYHHMKNIIGVNPSFYEYILMVDADTEVFSDSLNRMVSVMINDSKIMGLCGETLISNQKTSWTTMIQVYEYFISHHLSKAFESLFGSVTCLPGCFCMYRVRTPIKNIPLLISPAIINEYSENNVNTLHLKNLLHLGEDRYLTTLMMKHFPSMKLSFTVDAQCKTVVPDRWPVLLSQRRRWINSTVHNLVELVMLPQLCGFCCFSLRFIVFLDLFSTVVQPAGMIYVVYLIYSLVTNRSTFPLLSIILIAAIYGLQVIIFLLKRQWAMIGWMFIYILSMPVIAFYVPLYAFWHFDDFSWGNTRLVTGEDGKKVAVIDAVPYDPSSVPLRKWAEHEKELYGNDETGSQYSAAASHSQSKSMIKNNTTASSSIYGTGAAAAPSSVYGGGIRSSMMSSHLGTYMSATSLPPITGAVPVASIPMQGSMYSGSVVLPMTPGYPVYSHHPSVLGSSSVAGSSVAAGAVAAQPTDEDILRELKRILATANLMTITKKQTREELSALFGVDLTPRKATINHFIEEILQGRL